MCVCVFMCVNEKCTQIRWRGMKTGPSPGRITIYVYIREGSLRKFHFLLFTTYTRLTVICIRMRCCCVRYLFIFLLPILSFFFFTPFL